MSDYKSYDNSRPDTNCYHEIIWHWLPGPKIVVRTLYIAGLVERAKIVEPIGYENRSQLSYY